jgi:hypothetical protein
VRPVLLSALKQGISRLRTKGGADPATLYDLTNGFVTLDGSVRSRPGTVQDTQLPPGTKGLCAFAGKLYVFASAPVAIEDSRYAAEILTHPTRADMPLAEIHFAAPFMGRLYVVAEFADGLVQHYYMRPADAWRAGHVYRAGDLVHPTTPNGYVYRATRLKPPAPAWTAGTARAAGDRIEPTVSNGYEYTVTAVQGENPRSGDTEPTWPAAIGAIVYEDSDVGTGNPPPPAPYDPPSGGSGGGGGRYGGYGGGDEIPPTVIQ